MASRRKPRDAQPVDWLGLDEDDELADAAAGLEVPDAGRTRYPDRIEPDEVEGWARDLQVSPARLREAIDQVGPNLEDVKRVLRAH